MRNLNKTYLLLPFPSKINKRKRREKSIIKSIRQSIKKNNIEKKIVHQIPSSSDGIVILMVLKNAMMSCCHQVIYQNAFDIHLKIMIIAHLKITSCQLFWNFHSAL